MPCLCMAKASAIIQILSRTGRYIHFLRWIDISECGVENMQYFNLLFYLDTINHLMHLLLFNVTYSSSYFILLLLLPKNHPLGAHSKVSHQSCVKLYLNCSNKNWKKKSFGPLFFQSAQLPVATTTRRDSRSSQAMSRKITFWMTFSKKLLERMDKHIAYYRDGLCFNHD